MASDLLWLSIQFGSMNHRVLMYSPSYVKGLKEELSLRHAVEQEDIEVLYEGMIQGDAERIVDGRVYEMRSRNHPIVGQPLETGVFIGEGVTLTQDVAVQSMRKVSLPGPTPYCITLHKETKRAYTVFGYRGIIHLVDKDRGCVLSPASRLRLGSVHLYVDWGTLRNHPVNKEEWLYDRLQQDYGVMEDSVMEGIHMAGVDGITQYQNTVMNWLDAMGHWEEEEESGQEEEEQEEEEEEEEEEQDAMEEFMEEAEYWR
jgi:hypothetical protein